MGECAAQADRVMKEENMEAGQHPSPQTRVMGWRNHYSPKYGRCFVLVTLQQDSGPPYYDELYDVFERRLMAMCTTAEQVSPFCSIQEGSDPAAGTCTVCKAFLDDHMDH